MLPIHPIADVKGTYRIVSPRGDRRGWAIPVLIRNTEYHYTAMSVFEDGVVDAWEGLDLPLLRRRIETGWVATHIPRRGRLVLGELGEVVVEKFEPSASGQEIEARALAAIAHYNTALANLVDLGGDPAHRVGKFRSAKLPSMDCTHVRKIDDATNVPALTSLVIDASSSKEPKLTRCFTYADGKVRIGTEGDLMGIDGLLEALRAGRLTTLASQGHWLEIDGVGAVRFAAYARVGISNTELVRRSRAYVTRIGGMALRRQRPSGRYPVVRVSEEAATSEPARDEASAPFRAGGRP